MAKQHRTVTDTPVTLRSVSGIAPGPDGGINPRSMLDVARYYKRLGWSAISVELPEFGNDESGKRAAKAWKLYMLGIATDAELEVLFRIPSNIAIVTGRISNLIFADLDSEEGKREWSMMAPPTPLRFSTGRGEQWGYKHPGITISNRVRLKVAGIDIRGDGGYSVVPPSLHWSGKPYVWHEKPTLALLNDVPNFPVDVLKQERKFDSSVIEASENRATQIRRAMAYIDKLEPAVSGQRGHDQTIRAAGILIQKFKLEISEAIPIMLMFNARCIPPWKDAELLRKLHEAQRLGGSSVSDG